MPRFSHDAAHMNDYSNKSFNGFDAFSKSNEHLVVNRVVREIREDGFGKEVTSEWIGKNTVEIKVLGHHDASIVVRFNIEKLSHEFLTELAIRKVRGIPKPAPFKDMLKIVVTEGYELPNGDRKYIPEKVRYYVETCQEAAYIMYLAVFDAKDSDISQENMVDDTDEIVVTKTAGEFVVNKREQKFRR